MPSAVSRLTSPRATLFPPALGLATAAYSRRALPTATAIGIRALCGLSYLAAGD